MLIVVRTRESGLREISTITTEIHHAKAKKDLKSMYKVFMFAVSFSFWLWRWWSKHSLQCPT